MQVLKVVTRECPRMGLYLGVLGGSYGELLERGGKKGTSGGGLSGGSSGAGLGVS